jgi:hypothetical protein
MLARSLEDSGGGLTEDETARADDVLGTGGRRTRSVA